MKFGASDNIVQVIVRPDKYRPFEARVALAATNRIVSIGLLSLRTLLVRGAFSHAAIPSNRARTITVT